MRSVKENFENEFLKLLKNFDYIISKANFLEISIELTESFRKVSENFEKMSIKIIFKYREKKQIFKIFRSFNDSTLVEYVKTLMVFRVKFKKMVYKILRKITEIKEFFMKF